MKTSTAFIFFLSSFFFSFSQTLSPYFEIGLVDENIDNTIIQLEGKIASEGYQVIGKYRPGNQDDLGVIVFTNDQTKSLCSQTTSQGIIAATYRIGLEATANGVLISAVNPEYQWRAYLTDGYESNAETFSSLYVQFESFCKKIGNGSLIPFGGVEDADDLENYHYMMGMPYYDDQVDIGSFESYQAAKETLEKSLNSTPGITHVYTVHDKKAQVSVYGIGLLDAEMGESHFLSIIGQSHAAALPYELIVEGTEVKMLHGRFRFALYWPELTMGTFTKIMSTPGDVEDLMKQLVK